MNRYAAMVKLQDNADAEPRTVVLAADFDAHAAELADIYVTLERMTQQHYDSLMAANERIDALRSQNTALIKNMGSSVHTERLLGERIAGLEAQLTTEKMAHSVTIAEEHESRSQFQELVAQLRSKAERLRELLNDSRMSHPEAIHTYECPCWRIGKKSGPCDCGGEELTARMNTALIAFGVKVIETPHEIAVREALKEPPHG